MKTFFINKKWVLNLLVISVLLITLFSCSREETAVSVVDDVVSFSILHFNDFHAAFFKIPNTNVEGTPLWGGASVLSGYLDKYRAENTNTLVAFAGDIFLQSPLDNASQGKFAVEVMNKLNVDIATVGNHEFDFGKDRFIELLDVMNFPIISANLFDRYTSDYIVDPYKIVTTPNGVKILFIGLFPEAGKGFYESRYEIEIKAAADAVINAVNMKGSEADFVAVLSHMGIDDDIALARRLAARNDVHLIIGGHSHTLIDEIDPNLPIPIVQAGANADHIGKVDIAFDMSSNTISDLQYQLVPLFAENVQINEEIEAMIQAEKNKHPELFKVIATTSAPLNHEDRLAETALGNFFVDAMVDRYRVDAAFLDSKIIRISIPGPNITKNDIFSALPFNNEVHKLKITGGKIIEMLEWHLNRRQDRYISIPYTLSYTFTERGGNFQIQELYFNDEPINRNKTYTIVVDDRMANNFVRFYDAENVGKLADLLSEEMVDYLQEINHYTPKPGNRRKQL